MVVVSECLLKLLLRILEESSDNFGPFLWKVALHVGNDTTDLTMHLLGTSWALSYVCEKMC